MATSDTSEPQPTPFTPFDDDEDIPYSPSRTPSPDLPLTMTASVHLADLNSRAADALAADVARLDAEAEARGKVIVRFKPVGSAPALERGDVFKVGGDQRFEFVVRMLRKKLRCKDTDSAFLYVNQAFAPSLDEVVGNLHQCFKDGNNQLVIAYSMTPAFG